MPSKSKAELQAELKFLRAFKNSQALVTVVVELIRWGGLVAIAYFALLSVKALAGQTTAANIGIKFLADVRVSEALAWIFGVVGSGYGFGERRLRRSTVERLQSRIRTLENKIDPKRSSSNLTPKGDTPKEDEI